MEQMESRTEQTEETREGQGIILARERVDEFERVAPFVWMVEGIEVAQALLQSAAKDIQLRRHYEPKSEDYALLTEALHKHLGLAKVAVTQAQSAEGARAEGLEFSPFVDAPESGHKAAGSDGHAV